MKVSQLRNVLKATASIHAKGDRPNLASALTLLSEALEPADRLTVIKAVEKLNDTAGQSCARPETQ